jgi:broad specificity phosphatase PhoE
MKKLMFCFLVILSASFAHADASATQNDKSIVKNLQKGGYILFLRHCQTNPDQADTDPLNLDNISAQRQLTDEGRKQATDLGQAFRDLHIPIGDIVSSRFYRAQETAKLLKVGTSTTSTDVSEGGQVVTPNENKRRTEALRRLLSTNPTPGKNNLIVSHRPNLQEAAGKEFGDLAECEVVVFQPSDGKFRLIARVAPSTLWTEWSK